MLLDSWLKKNGVDFEGVTTAPALTRGMEAGALPSFHQALPRLELEVGRARRYERPITIGLIATDDAQTPSLVTLLLAALVREALRETDIVAYAPSLALCIVGLPEARKAGAQAAIERVQALCLERLMIPVRAGLAEFPVAGWSLEALIKEAELDALRKGVNAFGAVSNPDPTANAD
jgi:hypothetical protein